MSARERLLTELDERLGEPFVVSARVATPEQIDPGRLAVRVFTSTVNPGPTTASLRWGLTVWVLTGSADPAQVDVVLDDALDTVLSALLDLGWLTFDSAERGVMEDADGPRFHGYRFSLTAHAEITEE